MLDESIDSDGGEEGRDECIREENDRIEIERLRGEEDCAYAGNLIVNDERFRLQLCLFLQGNNLRLRNTVGATILHYPPSGSHAPTVQTPRTRECTSFPFGITQRHTCRTAKSESHLFKSSKKSDSGPNLRSPYLT